MPFTVPVALGLLALFETPPNTTPARTAEVIGFGLVVGLDGTGSRSTFTRQVVVDMMHRLGVDRVRLQEIADRRMNERLGPCRRPLAGSLEASVLNPTSCSAVLVTATIRAGASKGDKLDLTVSCMDDATSLRGGVLLLAPLKGADGQVYAVGQGPLGERLDDQTRTATVWNGGLIEVALSVNGAGFMSPRIRGARGETR